MKYYSSKTVTQILWVTAQTLRNWDKEGHTDIHINSVKAKFSCFLTML